MTQGKAVNLGFDVAGIESGRFHNRLRWVAHQNQREPVTLVARLDDLLGKLLCSLESRGVDGSVIHRIRTVNNQHHMPRLTLPQ